jgi:hypothetical protein
MCLRISVLASFIDAPQMVEGSQFRFQEQSGRYLLPRFGNAYLQRFLQVAKRQTKSASLTSKAMWSYLILDQWLGFWRGPTKLCALTIG